MKTRKNLLSIIAIGVIIILGMNACVSTAKELDNNILNTMENASWEVKALVYSPSLFFNNNFIELTKDEVSYFESLSVIKKLEFYKDYALTAPEFPDTYYYVRKTDGTSLDRLLGSPFYLTVYKSTTIDEEAWTYRNSLRSVFWEVKVLPNQPSLDGFEELVINGGSEDMLFLDNLMDRGKEPGRDIPGNTWCEISSSQMSDLTYYYYTGSSRDQSFIRITTEKAYKKQK